MARLTLRLRGMYGAWFFNAAVHYHLPLVLRAYRYSIRGTVLPRTYLPTLACCATLPRAALPLRADACTLFLAAQHALRLRSPSVLFLFSCEARHFVLFLCLFVCSFCCLDTTVLPSTHHSAPAKFSGTTAPQFAFLPFCVASPVLVPFSCTCYLPPVSWVVPAIAWFAWPSSCLPAAAHIQLPFLMCMLPTCLLPVTLCEPAHWRRNTHSHYYLTAFLVTTALRLRHSMEPDA